MRNALIGLLAGAALLAGVASAESQSGRNSGNTNTSTAGGTPTIPRTLPGEGWGPNNPYTPSDPKLTQCHGGGQPPCPPRR
jgi:hypothetical protein